MEFHGRYRVVRRAPADLRQNAEGLWYVHNVAGVVVIFSREQIREMTGESPEENAAGGWRCFWQETPRVVPMLAPPRNGLERR